MELNNFLTIDYLKSFMGTVVVTMLMVQFFKELPGIKKIPTRYFTFLVALFNILMCAILTDSFTIVGLYLMLINAMLVTFTATGGYDFTIGKINTKTVSEIKPTGIITEFRD